MPRLIWKMIRKRKLKEEKNIDLAQAEYEAGAEEQLVKVKSAPRKSRIYAILSKKRRYVAPPADEISANDTPTVEEEQVLKHSVAVEKPHQPKAMSSDESNKEQQEQKQKRRQKKKQKDQHKQHQKQEQPKTALLQSSDGASTSKTISEPCEDRVCLGASASGFLLSTYHQVSNHDMWLDTMKKSFDPLETTKVLRDVKLTEKQSEILQRAFMQVCEKTSNVKIHSDHFEKINNCFNCMFSISHQCLPFDFIRSIPFGSQLMNPETIMPNRTVICKCGFAFLHAHLKRYRAPPVVENTYTKYTAHLQEISRSVNVRCRKCHIKVVMTNHTSNVCCGLTKWDDMAEDNREDFYNAVQSCLHYPPRNTPSLDEFSACRKNCCLFFHRCSGKDKLSGAQSTSPG